MKSKILKITKNIVVLTLVVGLFVIPTYPLWGEEISVPEVVTPTPVVLETETPALEEPVIVPEVSIDVASTTLPLPVVITETEVASSTNIENVEEVTVPVVDIAPEPSAPVTIDEPKSLGIDDSLAISEEVSSSETEIIPIDVESLAISDELGSDTSGDVDSETLAISDELSADSNGEPFSDTLAISEENVFSSQTELVDNLAISNEINATTTQVVVDTLAVSAENNFTTQNIPITDTLAISTEYNFNTQINPPVDTLAISAESNFSTLSGGIETDPAISGELSFDTLPNNPPVDTLAISEEKNFDTQDAVDPDTLTVSEELNFTTLPGATDTLSISEENSFTTQSSGGGGGGGGSGGGGGGGGYRQPVPEVPYACSIFLKKFIKYGQVNDRIEVIKLQVFLRVFEGFDNLKVTGVYDLPTYRAVEIFQKRYGKDVLGPWGINDSTGYVYITTRMAINNIFCNRPTTNNMDLRDRFYREYQEITKETNTVSLATSTDAGYYLFPTTTDSAAAPVIKRSWLMAGLGSLLGFIGDNLCWLLNLFLLLVIFFLLWLLWLSENEKADKKLLNEDTVTPDFVVKENSNDFGLIGAVSLDEIMSDDDQLVLAALAEEEESQIPAANNNPLQETIILGAETNKKDEVSE